MTNDEEQGKKRTEGILDEAPQGKQLTGEGNAQRAKHEEW
jgi:hypothetical protein